MRFLIVVGVFSGMGVFAQTNSKNYSLPQCVEYALANSTAIKNATIDEYIANAKVGEVRSFGLPQITGNLQILDNPQLPRQFLSANNPILAGFGFAGGKPNDVVAIPNLFQLRSTSQAYLSVNQLIFDGSYIVGLQAARTYRELAKKATQQSRVETIQNVTKAYYLVLITNERLNLLYSNLAKLDTSLAQVKALNKSGFAEKIDVSRLEVAYNNLLSEKEKILNLAKMSLLMLKYQMGMPINEEIELTGKISDEQISDIPSKSDMAYSNRIEYSLLETQKRAQKLDLRNNKVAYLPRLVAFGNIGYNTANVEVAKLTKNYYEYSFLGLSMVLPIFDGFGKMYKVQQSRGKLEQVENNMNLLKNTIDLQVTNGEISFQNAKKSLEIQRKNMELAEEVQRVSQLKYTQGIGSSLEVVTAETSYKEAQTNYYSALYDAIVAKIDFDIALGNIK